MKNFIIFLLALQAGFTCKLSLAKGGFRAGCGAVAPDGRFAGALLDASGVELEVSAADGSIEKARLGLSAAPEECRLAFDHSGKYVAVGVRVDQGSKKRLHIGVFNTFAQKWVSRFKVDSQLGMPFPIRFEGFLEDTSTIVVTGYSHNTGTNPDRSSVAVALFSPDGHLLQPVIERKVPGAYFNWLADFADAAHNRLWFNHDPTFCPLSSTSLVGHPNPVPTVEGSTVGDVACDVPESLGFPDMGTIIGASTRSDTTWVWRVDLREDKGEKLQLPPAHRAWNIRANEYHTVGSLPVSSDGKVFAVPRTVLGWDMFDLPHFGMGIVYVLQVKPLRLLGGVKAKKGCGPAAVAVDHTNGRTTVLSHECKGGWKLVPVLSVGK